MNSLVPVLSEDERKDLIAYFSVYKNYAQDVGKKVSEDLKNHPVFGFLIKNTWEEIVETNNILSLELQRNAIEKNDWKPYINHQIEQGAIYAKMGIDFKVWYEMTTLVKKYIRPLIHSEYENKDDLFSAFTGMNLFTDIATSIIGESYIKEKNKLMLIEKEALKKSNEFFSTLFSYNPGAIAISQLNNGKIIAVNEAFLSLYKVDSKDDVVGKTSEDLGFFVTSGQRKKIVEIVEKQGIIKNYEVQVKNALNEVVWISSSITLIELDTIPCLFSISIAISERKLVEEKIKDLNEELEERVVERTIQLEASNKELEAFTYSVSHDLRTPLRAVNGYAEILKEDYGDQLDTEAKRVINVICANASKMDTLIDELLSFSRLGKKEVQKTEVNLNELVSEVMDELSLSVPPKAKIIVEKLHSVSADSELLYHVLLNLLSNAVKYSSKKEKPVINIFSEETGNNITVTIKDNGVGFNIKYVDKLFGVFQRLHSQEEFQGIGIGLAIVQRIITKHNGAVWAEGKEGNGAVFKFSLEKKLLNN